MDLKHTLSDTIDWMQSDDYKERLKAEYWQLVIRMERLRRVVVSRFRNEDLGRVNALLDQFDLMKEYKHILEQRANAENIDLDNDDVVMW